jgi:hypothetical protein
VVEIDNVMIDCVNEGRDLDEKKKSILLGANTMSK